MVIIDQICGCRVRQDVIGLPGMRGYKTLNTRASEAPSNHATVQYRTYSSPGSEVHRQQRSTSPDHYRTPQETPTADYYEPSPSPPLARVVDPLPPPVAKHPTPTATKGALSEEDLYARALGMTIRR